ncbi:reverse transcriptase [Gossypium australe]|uniref:Reverse transcriptase n=1 Tax=Gossypium australe TaxID=47621 RepID=A0A5B6WTC7_9ROSI|nr:reverse transcriptase [Gossypium australe]
MLTSLGFCQEWIILVMRCVCSVSYTVGINEGISESFIPSRGLRQGDPLSPFLFLICAEGLSTLLNEAKKDKLMIGAPIGRERFEINHLLFADDCMLFRDASVTRAFTVRSIMEDVDKQVREQVTNILGVREATNPEKYLGLPMMVGRRKRWAFANFIDRFRKRIDSWKFRFLSMGGKEVFIKAILQAIPIYVIQCFELPKSLCNTLENIMNKYWWANGKTGKGIHWCSWKDLCYSKNDGGMGFRDLSFFNKALLAKQAWRLLTQPDCLLAKVYKARYFPFTNFLSASVGSYPSFTWRSICGARELIDNGLIWRIGNGKMVNIWNDPWLLGNDNNRLLVQNMNIQWTTVNHLIDDSSFTWKEDVILKIAESDQANRILSIPLARPDAEDILVWRYDNKGIYTVKSGYRVLITSRSQTISNTMDDTGKYKSFYKQLWELQLPSKIKVHMWRLIKNYIPHLCNLHKRKLTTEVVCPLCKAGPEDANHLMWSCDFVRRLWKLLDLYAGLGNSTSEGKDQLVSIFTAMTDEKRKLLSISLWAIWFMRNKLIHEGRKFSMQETVRFIQRYVHELQMSCKSDFTPDTKKAIFWRPPPVDFVKLNFDASFDKESKSAITAVVARNDEGLIMGACVYQCTEVADAFVAEARACERAILFAMDMGFQKIILEGDSLTVIKKLRSAKNDRSVIRSIIQNICKIATLVEEVSFSFSPRKGNQAAHTLAMEGYRWPLPCCWIEEIPDSVNSIVMKNWEVWLQAQT